MTDKQIIIDGVDVRGCSYSEIEQGKFKCSCEYNVRTASMYCCDNPNCYYKQLKRKEQECEELERQYKDLQEDLLNCTACRTTEKLGNKNNLLETELNQIKLLLE